MDFVIKSKELQKSTMIFLHGLGDVGQSWAPLAYFIQEKIPSMKFIFPTAETRAVTINSGMKMPAWYDLDSLSSRSQKELIGLEESSSRLEKIVKQEKQANSIGSIFVGGFSQGGALALFTSLLRLNQKIDGILGLSCYMPKPHLFPKELRPENKDTSILLCHGDSDPMVLPEWGKSTFNLLKNQNLKIEQKIYPFLQHDINRDELDDIREWIEKRLKNN
ncbi:acyl protein thioesterase family [Anaeramoeba ignava]|uniref:Acyl protein thioesterase family n=1 Tax=Anaeramoeba ignava TaxID=1746090 RepID=A0A9Q0L622_ANAIG|nr:acyl protein thioesterase family [Anaeramoeba ignava]